MVAPPAVLGPDLSAAFGGVFLGIALDSPTRALPAYDQWFDEVAFDTTRIGCDR